jgi:hypothetical protein
VHAFADTETPSANSSSDVVAPSLETVTSISNLDFAKAEPVNMSVIVADALTDHERKLASPKERERGKREERDTTQ